MKKALITGLLATLSFQSMATVVEMKTSQGTITIDLFDTHTPITVENFLTYVEQGSYDNTVIHRSVKDFVIQGGGYSYEGEFTAIETNEAIKNEPVLSNVAGTVAMAKLSGDENSATSQWFFNLTDNSGNLDVQNGGFTVFGQIRAENVEVLEAISALQHCDSIPLVNITQEQCSDENTVISNENLVTVESVVVIDSNENSSASLSPAENTLIDEPSVTPEPDNGSSGGSFAWMLALLAMFGCRRNYAN